MQTATRPRVLLVEGDQEGCTPIKLRCEHEGFEVLSAKSCDEALRLSRERRPGIVISEMPSGLQRESLERLRKAHDLSSPVLLLIANAEDLPEREAYALGVSACLRKPLDLDALIAACNHFHKESEVKKELLRELDAAKRNFDAKVPVSAVAHELMNPLMVLRGTLASMIRKLGQADARNLDSVHDALKLAELAFRNAERIVRLLKGLRTLASETRDMETVDLQAVTKETVKAMQEEFSAIPIDWHLDIEPGDYHVNAATGTAELMLANLTKNAAEAVLSRPHPRVKVKLERRNESGSEQIVLRVEDNGVGVPLEWSARVFEALTTTKRHLGGTGLGLYLCREAAFRLGGTISLVSPARPTAFEIVLPAKQEPQSME